MLCRWSPTLTIDSTFIRERKEGGGQSRANSQVLIRADISRKGGRGKDEPEAGLPDHEKKGKKKKKKRKSGDHLHIMAPARLPKKKGEEGDAVAASRMASRVRFRGKKERKRERKKREEVRGPSPILPKRGEERKRAGNQACLQSRLMPERRRGEEKNGKREGGAQPDHHRIVRRYEEEKKKRGEKRKKGKVIMVLRPFPCARVSPIEKKRRRGKHDANMPLPKKKGKEGKRRMSIVPTFTSLSPIWKKKEKRGKREKVCRPLPWREEGGGGRREVAATT